MELPDAKLVRRLVGVFVSVSNAVRLLPRFSVFLPLRIRTRIQHCKTPSPLSAFLPLRISVHRPFANHNYIHQSPPCPSRQVIRRSHKKSRLSCHECKRRHIKVCDLHLPREHCNDFSSATEHSPRARIACGDHRTRLSPTHSI